MMNDSELIHKLQTLPPELKELYLQRYAVAQGVTVNEAAEVFRKFENGETVAELESLKDQVKRLQEDIRRYQSLKAIYVPRARPWMMALEMMFVCMRNLRDEQQTITGSIHVCADEVFQAITDEKDLTKEQQDLVAQGMIDNQLSILRKADAYAWSSDTATAAWMASQTIPDETVVNEVMLPGRSGWWWFETPLGVKTTSDGQGLSAVLWESHEHGLAFDTFVMDEAKGPMFSLGWTWPTGFSWLDLAEGVRSGKCVVVRRSVFPSEQAHESIAQISRLFLAGCAWLQQKVVVESGGHIERHRRKQLTRENGDVPIAPEVRVIQLRKRESSGSHVESHGDGAPIEWSCRWVVSGHWRNQYYATTKERKLIYIMPFVKGPADKPLRQQPQHTVYQVSR